MYLHDAIDRLMWKAPGASIFVEGMGEGGVYLESFEGPLRFRRFPDSHGWPWTPSATQLMHGGWTIREAKVTE